MREKLATYLKEHNRVLILGAIIAVAVFMRFYRLDSLPPGLHADEAANGLDIFTILEHHTIQPFYATNGGRESLFFMLQAVFVAIFGNTTLALRIAPALIGVLAVGAVYLWASTWFSRRVGLIAAFMMAVTPWAVTISRDGFRAGMVALIIPLVLWLARSAYITRSVRRAVITGVIFGAGFYTYTAYQFFGITALVGLGYLFVTNPKELASRINIVLVAGGAALLTMVPIALYAALHPGQVFGRAFGVSFMNSSINHGTPLADMGNTLIKTLLMFNFKGDSNYRLNLGGQPELNIFVGVMFVLGLVVAGRYIRSKRYAALLFVFILMLLPEILSDEGIPHSLRAIGVLPAIMVLAAIGIDYLLRVWHRVFPLNTAARVSSTIAISVLLLLTAYQGYVQYFVAWANAQQTYTAYDEDMTSLASYYNTHSYSGKRYVVADAYRTQPLAYLTHKKASYSLISDDKIATIPQTTSGIEFAVPSTDKNEALKRLRESFPKGRISPHYSDFSGDELFVTYTVPTP